MREPSDDLDGWSLDDGEQRSAASPDTFIIPPRWVREALEPGDFAQLIFKIVFDDDDEPFFERMWVIVNALTDDGYMGILNNTPASVEENDRFWVGTELPFAPQHIIDVREGNVESAAIAARPPPISWPPSA